MNECTSLPCQNGGTCSTSADILNTYICTCRAGYTGDNCAMEVDECLSDPCQHGGTCAEQFNGYLCWCPSGTAGELTGITNTPTINAMFLLKINSRHNCHIPLYIC